MKDGTGASVLVYHDQTINDSTVRLVLKRIGELRAYAVKLRGERNIIKSLSDAQVRSDVISKLSVLDRDSEGIASISLLLRSRSGRRSEEETDGSDPHYQPNPIPRFNFPATMLPSKEDVFNSPTRSERLLPLRTGFRPTLRHACISRFEK